MNVFRNCADGPVVQVASVNVTPTGRVGVVVLTHVPAVSTAALPETSPLEREMLYSAAMVPGRVAGVATAASPLTVPDTSYSPVAVLQTADAANTSSSG